MTHTPVAVINGGGIAGLSHAITLGRRGWSVLVTERAPEPRRDGFMIGFYGRGFDALSVLDLEAPLWRIGRDYAGAEYVDRTDRVTARVSLDGFRRATQGRFVSLLRPELEELLRAALPDSVDLRFGVTVVGFNPGRFDPRQPEWGRAEARLSDGSTVECDLLLGADGLHSQIRDMLGYGEPSVLRPLGLHTSAWAVPDPELAEQLGEVVRVSDVTGGQIGLFALDAAVPGQRPESDHGVVAGYAVFTGGPELPEDPDARLRSELSRHGSVTRRVADLLPSRVFHDLVAQSVVPSWRIGRTLLVGDAAHAVSPVAGQGASLAIAGAVALGDALDGTENLPAALRRYEAEWRPVVEPVQRLARRTAPSYIARNPVATCARRIALRAAGLPFLERVVTRRIGRTG